MLVTVDIDTDDVHVVGRAGGGPFVLSMCMSFNDEEDAAAKGGGDGAVVNCLKMTWAPLRLSQAYHATLVVKNALTAFRKKPGQGRSKL